MRVEYLIRRCIWGMFILTGSLDKSGGGGSPLQNKMIEDAMQQGIASQIGRWR
jgi:hypothetical protein